MLTAIDIVLEQKKHFSLEIIKKDPFIFFAFVKQIEIIGEAVYRLTKEFRENHPEVEWDVIEGMRHVLVHGYYEIQPEKLWDTIEYDLPALRPLIVNLISEHSKS